MTGLAVSPHIAGLTTIVGREEELRELRAAFRSDRVRVLAGMGGVGKTSVARAYAHRHLDDYGIIWWVRAEDAAAIEADFRALLEILLPPKDAARVGNARTAIFAQLAKQQDPWLLVLDNVPGAEAINGLLPPVGNGHVLITSRSSGWPDSTAVEPLDTDAAVELLTSRSGDGDREAAEALASELGGLPLVLTQAAGFVRTCATTLGTYLKLYRDRGAELHREGRPADYPHTVATTWKLAMERLTEPAREMLNVLALCAPDEIPVHAIFGAMDELARHRGLGELLAHSLVTPTTAVRDGVVMHRVVQAVTRDQLGPQVHEWTDRARELIMAALLETYPGRGGTAAALITWLVIQRHAVAVLDRLPPEHPDTMTARFQLAEAKGGFFLGDRHGARDVLAELLPVQRRVLGDEHPDTLLTWGRLAVWTERAGDPARARDLAADQLLVEERVLGAEHVHTLATRSNLASWTGNAGDPAGARDLLIELVPIAERVDHPDLLIIRHNLAYWSGVAGDATRARDLFAELVSMCERMLGTDNPHTADARAQLAHWAELADQIEEEGPGGGGEGEG